MAAQLLQMVQSFFQKYYFGFIIGHRYLSNIDLGRLKKIIYEPETDLRASYENKFSSEIGKGMSLSYASGRMAFYSLLKVFNVKEDDEVIITGFTCSVMVNAIIRVGAKPIFVDIDPNNFGTSPEDVLSKITMKTKVIVAQHSFGIPCRIDEIKTIAEINNIKLVEDCALAFKSKYKGVVLGNFGDAAIFSTDHSKPINTLVGGMVYTNNNSLFDSLLSMYNLLPDLSIQHQKNIFRQIRIERILCTPKMYKFYKPVSLLIVVLEKLNIKKTQTFLSNDSSAKISNSKYPYPAKLPLFLCFLGLMELEKFDIEGKKIILEDYLKILPSLDSRFIIPDCYKMNDNEIVPLRVVFLLNDDKMAQKISNLIDSSWYWFKSPIVATSDNLKEFNYKLGSCPNSERISLNIVNFPVVFNEKENKIIYNKIKKLI